MNAIYSLDNNINFSVSILSNHLDILKDKIEPVVFPEKSK